MTVILYAIGAAVIFGLSNAMAYNRGDQKGYNDGYNEGVNSKISEICPGRYRVEKVLEEKE